MKRQRLNCHFLKRWKISGIPLLLIVRLDSLYFSFCLYYWQQGAPKTNLSLPKKEKKKQPHLSHPISSSGLPWNTATASFSRDLAGGCGLLLSVPLTSILSVKNSIAHCWKQQFANQASLESCLMEHYREGKGKFKHICFSNFLKESQTELAL